MSLTPKVFDTPLAREAQARRFGNYESKPGDPRRSGKSERAPRELLSFVNFSGRIAARLGAITVGTISVNPNGGRLQFFWTICLPMFSVSPQPAADEEKAKSAIRHKVSQWVEAAGLTRRGKP